MPSLLFKGKVFVENHHLVVPFHELQPVRSRGLSKKASLHDNLIVEGDNLAALKALLPTCHGKVKCIYIDPPYNTGNESWVYNDNVNSPMMRDWLGKVVDREDLTRHDKWCCMMLPRLKLLRELLRNDGAIFVSIDDNEVHRLRSLMDEVFGEDNFLATDNLAEEGVLSEEHRQVLFGETMISFVVYAQKHRGVVSTRTAPGAREAGESSGTRTRTMILVAQCETSSDLDCTKSVLARVSALNTNVTSPSVKDVQRAFAVGNYFRRYLEGQVRWNSTRTAGSGGDPDGRQHASRLKRYLSEVKQGCGAADDCGLTFGGRAYTGRQEGARLRAGFFRRDFGGRIQYSQA